MGNLTVSQSFWIFFPLKRNLLKKEKEKKNALELQLGRPQSRKKELDAQKHNELLRRRWSQQFLSEPCELCLMPESHNRGSL